VEPRSDILNPDVQRINDWVQYIRAVVSNRRSDPFSQSCKRRVPCAWIERPAANPEHPAVKAVLAGRPSETRRQMKRFPNEPVPVVFSVMIRASADHGNFGKWRCEQVAAASHQPSMIPENEEMIDERSMPLNRPQFGIDGPMTIFGIAGAALHLRMIHQPDPLFQGGR
jgi:hypothetical protein